MTSKFSASFSDTSSFAEDEHSAGGTTPRPFSTRRRWRAEGWGLLALAAMVMFAAVNTGTNLLYLALSMMLAILLFSWVAGAINLMSLRAFLQGPGELHAEQPGAMRVDLKNNKRRAGTSSLIVRVWLDGGQWQGDAFSGFMPHVGPQATMPVRVPVQFQQRGRFQIERLSLASSFPFGLVEREKTYRIEQAVLVLPRLLAPKTVAPYLLHLVGEGSNERRGMGSEIYGIRDYQPTDPARLIHWKHTARGQGVKVKEFESEQSHQCVIWLDTQAPSPATATEHARFEKAVSAAATALHFLTNKQVPLGLWTPQGYLAPAAGRAQLMKALRLLAEVRMLEGVGTKSPQNLPARTALVRIDWGNAKATAQSTVAGMQVIEIPVEQLSDEAHEGAERYTQ